MSLPSRALVAIDLRAEHDFRCVSVVVAEAYALGRLVDRDAIDPAWPEMLRILSEDLRLSLTEAGLLDRIRHFFVTGDVAIANTDEELPK